LQSRCCTPLLNFLILSPGKKDTPMVRISVAKGAVLVLTLIVVAQTVFLFSLVGHLEDEEDLSSSTTDTSVDSTSLQRPKPPEKSGDSGVKVPPQRAEKYLTAAALIAEIDAFVYPRFYTSSTVAASTAAPSKEPTTADYEFVAQPQNTTRAESAHTTTAAPAEVSTATPPRETPLPKSMMASTSAPPFPFRRRHHVGLLKGIDRDVFADTRPSGVHDNSMFIVRAAPTEVVHLRDAAVLVLCYNRPDYLATTLQSVISARLSNRVKKYLSQDGDDPITKSTAMSFNAFEYISHQRSLPRLMDGVRGDDGQPKETPATMFLAAHYKWALDELFLRRNHSHVVVLEDDMKVSKDFFEMFEALAPLLDADPTLWCISSWNDNGFQTFELPEGKFFRSSYFPGLGWMLRRSLWEELSPAFPEDNWDHWMRATTTSKHRECISPWISRNYNIGVGGATSNQEFYVQFLEPIKLYRGAPIGYGDISYLLNAQYFADMERRIRSVPLERHISAPMLQSPAAQLSGAVSYVVYYSHEEAELLGQVLMVHPSPRSFYRHSTWLKYRGSDVFIVDRRLSPFIRDDLRLAPHRYLAAVPSPQSGLSCTEVCRVHPPTEEAERWECSAEQFDFLNDCEVLKEHFGCPNGCTQGWGNDIPNTETEQLRRKPMCLTTEVVPNCEASFPFTKRLCPCIGTPRRSPVSSGAVHPVPADQPGVNCADTCKRFRGDNNTPFGVASWRCDEEYFSYLQDCGEMHKHFPCEKCEKNRGSDLPSYVSAKTDGNFKKCLISDYPSTCAGSHPNTIRLCPCSPDT
jgi:alpha-1,3-mannosyl-glycoprotein beta-1,2-N-acetylglucosaminyltransferase